MKSLICTGNLFFSFAFSCFSISVFAQTVLPPNELKTLGQALPSIALIDDQGHRFLLKDLEKEVVILNPVYTHCSGTCSLITKNLAKAISKLQSSRPFSVITLSFDDKSPSVKELAAYKQKLKLPPYWRVASGNRNEVLSLLASADFKIITLENGEFEHPNLILILSKGLKIHQYLYGIDFKTFDLKKAIESADGK